MTETARTIYDRYYSEELDTVYSTEVGFGEWCQSAFDTLAARTALQNFLNRKPNSEEKLRSILFDEIEQFAADMASDREFGVRKFPKQPTALEMVGEIVRPVKP